MNQLLIMDVVDTTGLLELLSGSNEDAIAANLPRRLNVLKVKLTEFMHETTHKI